MVAAPSANPPLVTPRRLMVTTGADEVLLHAFVAESALVVLAPLPNVTPADHNAGWVGESRSPCSALTLMRRPEETCLERQTQRRPCMAGNASTGGG